MFLHICYFHTFCHTFQTLENGEIKLIQWINSKYDTFLHSLKFAIL